MNLEEIPTGRYVTLQRKVPILSIYNDDAPLTLEASPLVLAMAEPPPRPIHTLPLCLFQRSSPYTHLSTMYSLSRTLTLSFHLPNGFPLLSRPPSFSLAYTFLTNSSLHPLHMAKPPKCTFNPFNYYTSCIYLYHIFHTHFHCSRPPILLFHLLLSNNSFLQHTLSKTGQEWADPKHSITLGYYTIERERIQKMAYGMMVEDTPSLTSHHHLLGYLHHSLVRTPLPYTFPGLQSTHPFINITFVFATFTFVQWHNNCLLPIIWYLSLLSWQATQEEHPLYYHCVSTIFQHFSVVIPSTPSAFPYLILAIDFSASVLSISILCISAHFHAHTRHYCFSSFKVILL